MKINYFKAIPVLVREIIKLLPYFMKYAKLIKEDVMYLYSEKQIKELDEEIKESLEVE